MCPCCSRILFLCLPSPVCGAVTCGKNSCQGTVQGRAFIQDSMGQSYIANAKVTLKGTTVVEAETNEGGKFEFLECSLGRTPLKSRHRD